MSKPLEPGMNRELSRCAAPSKGLLIKLYPAYSVLAGSAASPLDMRPSTGDFFSSPLVCGVFIRRGFSSSKTTRAIVFTDTGNNAVYPGFDE
jgi:hypothetical protein